MLKIEIDPLQPKVTVVGNVDPQTLIKKLFKLAGKQAEVWNAKGNNNELAANGRKEAKTHEEEKSESGGCDKAKCADSSSSSCGTSSVNYKRSTRSDEVIVKEITAAAAAGDGGKGANSNEDDYHGKQMNKKIAVPISYSNSVHDHELQLCPVHIPIPIAGTQYHYMAGQVQPPYTVNVQPCYAMSSCYVTEAPPPLIPSTKCYAQAQAQPSANYHYPPVQSHPIIFQAPATRVGDYFSDDNTVGCSVM